MGSHSLPRSGTQWLVKMTRMKTTRRMVVRERRKKMPKVMRKTKSRSQQPKRQKRHERQLVTTCDAEPWRAMLSRGLVDVGIPQFKHATMSLYVNVSLHKK